NIKKIGYQINDTIENLIEDFAIVPYFRFILLGLMSALLLIIGMWVYRWNNNRALRNAQVDLSECLFAYDRAQKDKDTNWDLVAQKAKDGYAAHSSTAVAPYFLLTQSDAL